MIQKGLLAVALIALTTTVALPARADEVLVVSPTEPRAVVVTTSSGATEVRVLQVPAATVTAVEVRSDYPAAAVRTDAITTEVVTSGVPGTKWCGGAHANNVGTNFGGC